MDGAKKARRSAATSTAMTRVAKSRKCPRCQRKAALSSPVVWPGIGRARKCNYCGHEVGILYGETFGYGVTPEPGVREVARDVSR
jgi:transcription elongation factor Elf1